jgi:DNA gyrase/topoisomerase IV subunit A
MIHPDDVAAWVAEVRQHPEAAPGIIEALASRLIELDEQNEALRDELVRLSRSRAPVGEEGRVATLTRRVQALERQIEQNAGVEPGTVSRSLLVFSLDGRGACVPLADVTIWHSGGDRDFIAQHLRPRHLLTAADTDELLLFSDKGRAERVAVADLESSEIPVNYLSLIPGLVLDLDEAIGVIVPLRFTFDRLTLVTRKGFARSFRRAEVDSLLERNLPLHSSPVQGDYPAFALLSDGKSELVLATRSGKGVRFPERVVGVQSKPAINLDRGDVVVGAAVVTDEMTLALVSADGVAVRREMAGFGAHATAGNRGKLLTRIPEVLTVAPVEDGDTLWLLTASGSLLSVSVDKVPRGPGASSGRGMVNSGDDRIVAVTVA